MKKLTVIIVMVLMILSQVGCGAKKEAYGIVELPQEKECSYDMAVKEGVKSVSLDDIEKLNNNQCVITYNENGDISFINGKYTDYKVTNFQEAYNSLMAIKELLMLPVEEMFPLRCHREDGVGTYYTFSVKDDNSYKLGWGVHVITDAEGTVQGLSVSYGDNKNGYNSGITPNAPEYTSNEIFEGLKSVETTAIDEKGDEVTISTLYDEEKDTYYLGDLERKIIFVEFCDGVSTKGEGKFLEAKKNKWSDSKAVSLLNDLIRVYDFFAEELGVCSVDGTGVPIMVAAHNTYNVSEYYGIFNDYACFSFADGHVGNLSTLGHEYIHGVLEANAISYGCANVQGMINEGYAQIIGHIVESYLDDSKKVDWYSAGGSEMNSYMKGKNYNNFYNPPAQKPGLLTNDYGEIHYNSYLLLNYAARLDEKQGLTKEEQLKLWMTTVYFANADECLDTLKQKLLLSAKLHDQEKWAQAVTEEYDNMKFPKDSSKDCWLHNTEEGYGRLTLKLDEQSILSQLQNEVENIEDINIKISVFDEQDGKELHLNTAGNYTCLLSAGEQNIIIVCTDSYGNEIGCSIKPYSVTIADGESLVITEIPKEYYPISVEKLGMAE